MKFIILYRVRLKWGQPQTLAAEINKIKPPMLGTNQMKRLRCARRHFKVTVTNWLTRASILPSRVNYQMLLTMLTQPGREVR